MRTPTQTVEVTTFRGPAERSEAIQAQLREILARIDAAPEVVAAQKALDIAKERHASLKQSQIRLMATMRELGKQLALEQRAAEEAMIESGSTEMLAGLGHLEAEHRLVSRANQRLVERMLPESEIVELSASGDQLASLARAVREEAHSRMEKTARLMAEAAEFEGHISFDPANTLSGALTAHAEELEAQADNHRRWAAERLEKHEQTLREIESIQLLRS